MALENDVQNLTKAIEALTAALVAQTKCIAPVEERKTEKPKEVSKVKESPKVEEEPVVDVKATEELSETITLAQVAAKFTDLVEANRPAAVALLAEFSIAKLGQAKPEQYGAILAAVEEALNG